MWELILFSVFWSRCSQSLPSFLTWFNHFPLDWTPVCADIICYIDCFFLNQKLLVHFCSTWRRSSLKKQSEGGRWWTYSSLNRAAASEQRRSAVQLHTDWAPSWTCTEKTDRRAVKQDRGGKQNQLVWRQKFKVEKYKITVVYTKITLLHVVDTG